MDASSERPFFYFTLKGMESMGKTAKAGGCGCLLLLVLLGVLMLVAVQNAPNNAGIPRSETSEPAITYPFILAANDGEGNVMEFYHATTAPSANDAKAFFARLKSEKSPKRFYVAVLVDDPKWAKAPNNPFTAIFGLKDQATMLHVNSLFEFNPLNGFSEGTVYETNMFESKATRFEIP